MRIIAGEARGRRIIAPEGMTTRPPLDRIRESLFEIIGDRVEGAEVLDLFAGAGAFGLEAISRGARRTTFVERDRHALKALERNIRDLGFAGRSRVVRGDAFVDPGGLPLLPAGRGDGAGGDPAGSGEDGPEAFDLAFVDPPFPLYRSPPEAARIADRTGSILDGLLRPGGLLVLRAPAGDPFEPPVAPADTRRFGESNVFLFERA